MKDSGSIEATAAPLQSPRRSRSPGLPRPFSRLRQSRLTERPIQQCCRALRDCFACASSAAGAARQFPEFYVAGAGIAASPPITRAAVGTKWFRKKCI